MGWLRAWGEAIEMQFHRREGDKEPSWLAFVGITQVSIVLISAAFVSFIFRPIAGIKHTKPPSGPNEV